ncbi:PREDICTED: protein BONZAI 3-like [Camelina sativa]|uniref:Protein BONZAI 3-like n=1 Tax=Camelina sativa TaxID=90675 RepID=A0ABM0YPE7_CAMSA|nr:PREDICTED: protein BONZAI 3-like [Camelina sativa]
MFILSDPMTVMYLRKKDGKLEEIGRTEVILNSLNPSWIEKITVSFQFEVVQTLVFHVYDVDTRNHKVPVKTLKLKDQEFLGEATCVLSEAIMEVGEVIQFYDSDKRFPAWRFGGRTSDGSVSHAFNLNEASYGDEVV